MWFCAYLKTPTQGCSKSLSPYWVKHSRIPLRTIYYLYRGFGWLLLFKAIKPHQQMAEGHIIPPPHRNTQNTRRIDWGLHGGQCSLGNLLIYDLQLQFFNKKHVYCWRNSIHKLLLLSCYLVFRAERDTDQSFFYLFKKCCAIQTAFLSISKSHTLLLRLCVPQRNTWA